MLEVEIIKVQIASSSQFEKNNVACRLYVEIASCNFGWKCTP
jgi:hypothetical protein